MRPFFRYLNLISLAIVLFMAIQAARQGETVRTGIYGFDVGILFQLVLMDLVRFIP